MKRNNFFVRTFKNVVNNLGYFFLAIGLAFLIFIAMVA